MFRVLSVAALLALYASTVSTGHVEGYHYEKPAVSLGLDSGPANLGHGHNFGPIPTTQPLPPVPALPPLPTPRRKGQIIQTQTLFQTHPVATTQSLPSTYLPSSGTGIGRIAQQYQSPGLQSPPPPQQQQPLAPALRTTAEYGFTAPSAPGTGLGSNSRNPAPAEAQPLRVPFGKQAVISFPTGASENTYQANGRQLKQYAVIEIIDNDIEQNTQPFLSSPFFDSFRAHVGASGTGATPQLVGGGIQLGSRSSASVLGQQLSATQVSGNDGVALGSGGLGFIRLANGNVYLGSGSLGYVSGQQHTQEVNEARTRTGAPQPDALHFGHGPLGIPNRVNRFFYRFK